MRGLYVFFVEPVKSAYALSELAMKATPLLLIALGLSVCFRSNVWNIGAEGQFIVGAIFASGVAMQAGPETGRWIVVPVLLAGVLGGMVWAGIVALLRDRFNASEILVSLMMVYIADMVLSYLVYGPWKDPAGYNFPQTITFLKSTQVPRLFDGSRVNLGLPIALAAGGGVLGAAVPHLRRLPAAGRRPGAGGGALRRLLVAQGAVDGAAAVGRHGRPGRCAGGRRAARPAHAARAGGLRLRGHHRRLRRPPAPGGRDLRGGADEHVLHRRRTGAVAPGPAQVADRRVPGPAAVHAAGLRHADPLPHPLEGGAAARGQARHCRCGGHHGHHRKEA